MCELDDFIAYAVCKGAKFLSCALEKRFSEHHATRVQWIALYYIDKREYITQKELADSMCLKEPTVVRLIDRMEKEEFIKRCNCSKDKRVKRLCLTDKGKSVYKELVGVALRFREDVLKGISDEEAEKFIEVMNRMVSNVVDLDNDFLMESGCDEE